MTIRAPSATRTLSLGLSALALGMGSVQAEESFIEGTRALGMGGAQVASVTDEQAQFYNPAAFGFFGNADAGSPSDNNDLWKQHFGLGVDATAGGRTNNNFATYADQIKTLYNNGTISNLTTNGIQNQSDAISAIQLASDLGNLTGKGVGASVDANGGVGMRIGHFGIGARIYAQASAWVSNVDTTNLGLGQSLGQGLNNVIAQNGGTAGDGTIGLFTPTQVTLLKTGPSALTQNQVLELDYLGRQAGISSSQAQGLVNIASQITTGGTLQNNTTAVTLYGFGAAEIPVSYGLAITDSLSLGVTGRLIIGRVYGSSVLVLQNNAEDALRNADKSYQQTTNFGIDVGAMYRMPDFNFGIIARNLNDPSFKGPTVDGITYPTYTLQPQVAAGAAFIPFPTLTLEVDIDATRNKTTLPGYDTQNLSGGIEWNILHFLALRAGGYRNLAEHDIGDIITAGLGINLWLMRIDAAGAIALKKTTVDGKSVPREAQASLQVLLDF